MSVGWKLLSYDAGQGAQGGVLVGDRVVPLENLPGAWSGMTATAVLEDWGYWSPVITESAAWAEVQGLPLDAVRLLAPILFPGAIYFAGINYHDHVLEMAERRKALGESGEVDRITSPWHGLKAGRACVVGPEADVAVPEGDAVNLDWEAELAVVIGRKAGAVSVAEAMDYVAGYTIANDLSARGLSRRQDVNATSTFRIDWLRHKSFDGACPLGPWITPADQLSDPQNLSIRLWVGDQLMQDSSTAQMIFGIAEQIAHLSQTTTLYPGDVILTGCPAGTASSHGGRYLVRGDRVTIEIAGLGELVTHIV